jgi:ubiquinol-cytochrome c reductase cytochrome c subunit
MRRVSLAVVILACLGAGAAAAPAWAGAAAAGHMLFVERCSSCHGVDGRGVEGKGPSLVGAGALAADFYLSTGRMPLAAPNLQPVRSSPSFSQVQIRRLVAYIASLGGPAIPQADPGAGSYIEGRAAFALNCAGCHQISGAGGVVTGGTVPALDQSTPTQIAEAVRLGPYLMPSFGPDQIDQHQLDSIARYVIDTTRRPDDAGGLPLGHLGPIPEGMVAWFVAIGALLLAARLTGQRAP